jgi:hypothetical protein
MKNVTFYHSILCPRCHVTNLLLARVLRRHPEVQVTRIELLTNISRARQDGVQSIPALVSQGRKLNGVILTPGNIERFLESLESGRA